MMIRTWMAASLMAAAALRAQAPAGARSDAPTDARTARPERPTVATHAFAVASGYLEIESGVARTTLDGARSRAGIVTAKLGVARRLQLTLASSITSASPGVPALDPVGAGLKWQLTAGDGGRPAIALLPGVTLPTGPRRARNAALSMLAVVTKSLGPLSVDLNAGVTRMNGVDGNVPYLWATAVTGPLHRALGWQVELSGAGDEAGGTSLLWLGALTFTVATPLVLDVGWSVQPDGARARTLFAGATWNVGRPFAR